MLIFTSILLISFGVISNANEDDICKAKRPTHCFDDVPEVPIDFPDSEEALDKICPVILPIIKCVSDFKRKCPETVMPIGIEENLDEIYAVMVEACDKDSELNKGLALHLPCIEKNILGHVATCKPMIKEVLEEMTTHPNLDLHSEGVFLDDEDRAKYICAREALDMTCFMASTSVKCGEEAVEIAGSVLDRVGILDSICPEDIRDEIKELLALVQPLMELGIAAEEMVSKIK